MSETYCEESAKHTDQNGEEDDQKKTKSGALVTSGLRVHDCEGERSVAADDRC